MLFKLITLLELGIFTNGPREIGWGCVEWIHLAWDTDRWWALVNAMMNLRVLAPQSLVSWGSSPV
jgi:hypothetical protein